MADENKTTVAQEFSRFRMRGVGLRAAALLFLAQFDRFMESAEIYPDDLAEARQKLVEALDE